VTTVNVDSAPASTPVQSAQAASPPDAAVQTVTENPAPANAPDASTAAAPPAAGASAAAAPIEIKPLPPHPAAARAAHRASSTKTASATDQSREEAPAPVSESMQRAAAVAPTHVATQSAVSHPRDRWARMDDDLARCTREDFIARVVCGQRVRFHYCSGYWGKVSQCPGSPAPEHGQ
jgi:hypothetical protein